MGWTVMLVLCCGLALAAYPAGPSPALGPFHPGIASWGGGDADGASGNYWWFDQAEPVWPHRTFPQPRTMHADWWELASDTGATKYKSASTPCEWPLKDSIWFFGTWYVPGAHRLYISPDGWVSFTSGTTPHPEPPAAFPNAAQPNTVIAPFWADWNPLGGAGTPEPNCIYYCYQHRTLIVEWYRVMQAGRVTPFTFQLQLSFGGKSCLYSSLSFSYHFVDFLYSAQAGAFPDYDKLTWPAQYLAGIENQDGSRGISVFADDLSYRPGRGYAIRCYYKKVFRYDVMAWDILSPGTVVLRYTKIEPRVVVANVGREIADFNLTFRIDSGTKTIYVATRPVTRLYQMDNADGLPWQDTIALPCWDRPGELGKAYSMHLTTSYAADLDDANDTLTRNASVGTEDDLTWPWHRRTGSRTSNNSGERLATAYSLSGGGLVAEVRCEFVPESLRWGEIRLEVWSARNGCGLPDRLIAHSNDILPGGCGSNDAWVRFESPVWVPSSRPGNFWLAWRPADNAEAGPLAGYSFYPEPPPPNGCFGARPGGNWSASASTPDGVTWQWGDGKNTWALVPTMHLALRTPPSPPCYDGTARDLAPARLGVGRNRCVEAMVPTTPVGSIANLGYRTESEPGRIFGIIAIDSGSTTVYRDSANLPKVGWLGDLADNPDTVGFTLRSWTPGPGGYWDSTVDWHRGTFYETRLVARLGAVGPDRSDHDPDNDTLFDGVEALWSHDPAAVPRDTNYTLQDKPFRVLGAFRNYGFHAERDVPVEARLYDERDSLLLASSVRLPWLASPADGPGAPDTASALFGTWRDGVGKGFRALRLDYRVSLPGDQDSSDDVVSQPHYLVYSRDLAVLEITSGAPRAGRTYYAHATFQNRGPGLAERIVSFRVLYRGIDVRTDREWLTVPLYTGETGENEFTEWRVPDSLAGCTVTLRAEVLGEDDDPSDDVVERNVTVTAAVAEPDREPVPTHYFFALAHSNPAHAGAWFEYGLPRAGAVELAVYDALGTRVALLARGLQPAGVHRASWCRTDQSGRAAAPGVYFVQLRAADWSASRKVVIAR